MNDYMKPEDVADMFKISRAKVVRYANAQRFPHLKFGQEIRFTPDHIEQIRAMYEVQTAEPDESTDVWGHRGRRSA